MRRRRRSLDFKCFFYAKSYIGWLTQPLILEARVLSKSIVWQAIRAAKTTLEVKLEGGAAKRAKPLSGS